MHRFEVPRLRSSGAAGSFRSELGVTFRFDVLPGPPSANRASAVVMMVELRELVVVTAVAGHRLPHCWWDGDERERDCS